MVYQLITGATVVAFLSLFGLALESVGFWTLPAFIATGSAYAFVVSAILLVLGGLVAHRIR